MAIRFHFQKNIMLRNRTKLKAFVQSVIKKEGFACGEVDFIFCTDESLMKINRDFLQHDYYTDIISFDYSDSRTVSGEIYISVDRVNENAGLYKTPVVKELHRVIFHGVLHFCGYKDKTKVEKAVMRNKEDELLRKYLG